MDQAIQQQGLRRQHRWIGIILLLPFLAWASTGIFFLVRPGFTQAYEAVPVRQYALPASTTLPIFPQSDWQEIRYFRSILGEHLLVRRDDGWQHLNAITSEIWPLANTDDLSLLLEDALQSNPDRYGNIVNVRENTATTDTSVQLSIDWNTMTISQTGRDTRWIDRIYSIHYLEWTGFYWTDRILGVGGLALLIYMTYTGALMAFGKQRSRLVDEQ